MWIAHSQQHNRSCSQSDGGPCAPRAMHTVISVSRLRVIVYQIYAGDPLQLMNISRLFMAHFFAKVFALKSKCRRKPPKIGSFWAPNFSGGNPPNSRHAFSSPTTFEHVIQSLVDSHSVISMCTLAIRNNGSKRFM